MNILGELLGGQNETTIRNVANQFDLSEKETQTGLAGLLPSLMNGMKQNASTEEGERALLEAIKNGNHSRYLVNDNPFEQQSTIDDGNGILGHLLGSKERSRDVASQASKATGLSSTVLKKLLPVAATMLMGSMGKSMAGGLVSSLVGGGGKSTKSSGIIGLLDFDNDGSVADDVFNIARKFF
ncbi:MAG: DUF937 domain-containing protein [Gammaproteobacteria bacterium]|nr:DUF937 domain-containing protein [Gammaproteobacteria bacterium]